MIPYIFTNNGTSLVIVNNGIPQPYGRGHPYFSRIVAAIKADDEAEVLQLTRDELRHLGTFDDVSVYNGIVTYKGEQLSNYLTDVICEASKNGQPIEPLARFLNRVSQNPDPRARGGLFRWVEETKLPITERGTFLAYKMVGANFYDIHSGLFDNSPGNVVSMNREDCDPNPEHTCSTGLHFCGMEYLKYYSWGPKVILLELDPADVVAFPKDYAGKGRCCAYRVLSEIDPEKVETYFEGMTGWYEFATTPSTFTLRFGGFDVVVDIDTHEYTLPDGYEGSYIEIDIAELHHTLPSLFVPGTYRNGALAYSSIFRTNETEAARLDALNFLLEQHDGEGESEDEEQDI